MYAISHLQAGSGTWYWVVHFSRRRKMFHRRFYEPMYGGSRNARAAAIAWRDEQLAQATALTVVEFCQTKRSNNTSGVPGVHFLKSLRQPEGFWQAKLTVGGGKYKSKSFSVLQHGNEEAYQMAATARAEMLENAKDRPYLHDPVAKRLVPKPKK